MEEEEDIAMEKRILEEEAKCPDLEEMKTKKKCPYLGKKAAGPPAKTPAAGPAPPKQMPIPQARNDEYREVAWAKPAFGAPFEPIWINRPKVQGQFVKLEMLFCGICHSDLHNGDNDMGGAMFPMVPGHELIGRVAEIGPEVTTVKVGDQVGVGVIIDSCLDCQMCNEGEENYCENGRFTHTYNTMKGKYE